MTRYNPLNFIKNDPNFKGRRRELRQNLTDAERAFWSVVRNRQFHGLKFYRQYSFGPYILDFYCPEKKLAVELDGGQHNQSDGREYDAIRTSYLNAHGVEVERFWNSDVLGNMEGVLVRLELTVAAVT